MLEKWNINVALLSLPFEIYFCRVYDKNVILEKFYILLKNLYFIVFILIMKFYRFLLSRHNNIQCMAVYATNFGHHIAYKWIPPANTTIIYSSWIFYRWGPILLLYSVLYMHHGLCHTINIYGLFHSVRDFYATCLCDVRIAGVRNNSSNFITICVQE